MIFVENILNTYLDLDAMIAESKMSKAQRRVVELTMRGWSCADIAEVAGVTPQTIHNHLMRGVLAIVDANNERWEIWAESVKR